MKNYIEKLETRGNLYLMQPIISYDCCRKGKGIFEIILNIKIEPNSINGDREDKPELIVLKWKLTEVFFF